MKIESLWAPITEPDASLMRSFVPGLEGKSIDERADAILLEAMRLGIFTGETQKTDPPLAANDVGPIGARWFLLNQATNSGKGPAVDCGWLTAWFIAECWAWGIFAREVAASFEDTNDITAEYWSEKYRDWVHVIPYTAGRFYCREGFADIPVGYQEWSQAERIGKGRRYVYSGLLPFYKPIDHYANLWRDKKFTTSAVIINGNQYAVTGKGPVVRMQVWKDPKERENSWKGEETDQESLYPDMSKAGK